MVNISPKQNVTTVSRNAIKILPVLLISLMPSAVQASCLIWTSWQSTRLSQEQCLSRAEFALRNIGFSKAFASLESAVYGENGEYSGTIRCAAPKGFVFFIVAGPSAPRASNLLERLENNF